MTDTLERTWKAKDFKYVTDFGHDLTFTSLLCTYCGFPAMDGLLHTICGDMVCKTCTRFPHLCKDERDMVLADDGKWMEVSRIPLLHNKLTEGIRVICQSDQCRKIMTREDCMKHYRENLCDGVVITCIHCQMSMPKKDKEKHEEKECTKKPDTCLYCLQTGPRDEIKEHETDISKCGHRDNETQESKSGSTFRLLCQLAHPDIRVWLTTQLLANVLSNNNNTNTNTTSPDTPTLASVVTLRNKRKRQPGDLPELIQQNNNKKQPKPKERKPSSMLRSSTRNILNRIYPDPLPIGMSREDFMNYIYDNLTMTERQIWEDCKRKNYKEFKGAVYHGISDNLRYKIYQEKVYFK